MGVALSAASCDLILSVGLHDGVITAGLESRSDTFDSSMLGLMARHYLKLLSSVADGPDRSIADLPLMTPEEMQQVLSTWNETHVSYPPDIRRKRSRECYH